MRTTLPLLGLLLVSASLLVGLTRPTEGLTARVDGDQRLRWVAQLPQPAPAWPDQSRMPFDRVPRPILREDRVFHGCTRTDSVVARNLATGEEVWRFRTGGPVRLPLTAWKDLILAASDDGYLYALDATTGEVRWQVRGGPSDRKILGNERLISLWPARGGPVLAADGDRATVYFAAGIWPFMGIFLHAVDADTGRIRWTCDGEGARYMKQPHNADSFAGVAPQGRLVVAGDLLLVPGGRSVPAAYNRHTGEFVHYRLADYGKNGNSEVQATPEFYLCGDSAFSVATGDLLQKLGDPSYLTGDRLYAWDRGILTEYDVSRVQVQREETVDSKGKKSTRSTWQPRRLGTVPIKETPLTLCRTSNRLYVGFANRVIALKLPLNAQDAAPVWEEKLADAVLTLAGDDDHLFAATRQGILYAFGPGPDETPRHQRDAYQPWVEPAAVVEQVANLLKTTGQRAGYALVVGEEQAGLARELVRSSSLRVILLVEDLRRLEAIRLRAQEAGIPGERLTILPGTLKTLDLPAYFANLVLLHDTESLEKAYASVRPYGGTLVVPTGGADRLKQFQPKLPVQATACGDILTRAGALPGAGNWTHEQGDAAGTRLSRDQIVKAPLGLLWFGGPSNEGILPRHGHGPQPHVIDGRAIIEGINLLRAIDIYTGRLLWEVTLPGVGKHYDNLAHQPGANSSGGNYVSLSDGIYIAVGKECLRIDPETGRQVQKFSVPKLPGVPGGAPWTYINVLDDYLIGGTLPDNPSGSKTKPAAPSSSKVLFALNRHTGKLLWSVTARNDGWRHNAVCLGGGRLYAIDRPSPQTLFSKEKDKPTGENRLVALDLATGKEIWTANTKVFGTNLAYSADHDVLIEDGRMARDTLKDESLGMRAYTGSTGQVRWFKPDYTGPCMLRGEQVLFGSNTSGRACSLLTGELLRRTDPLTGELVPWSWTRHYGCNTPMASENLITFRSGAAGFYDLCNESGTGNLGGFRSGCTNNLVVAGGLLVVPDYTRTCTCSYQNQCSVALIPMPEADLWTFQGGSSEIKGVIRRVGVLLGAPGNRKSDSGTLWMEYPPSGSPGPRPSVEITPQPTYFRRHPSQIQGNPAWVGASGAVGLQQVKLQLGPKDTPARRCTVRLSFVEPEDRKVGERVFGVAINGKSVLARLDVRAEAGSPWRLITREFPGIELRDTLEIGLTPENPASPAVLCGIEVVQD